MLAKLYENDLRTVYGNNLRMISKLCDTEIDGLSTIIAKNKIRYRQMPVDEEWRMPLLTEMLFARENNVEMEGLTRNDMNHIITYVCTI